MRKHFGDNNNISVVRRGEFLAVTCSCDYESDRFRKSELYINEERFKSDVEYLWDVLKRKSTLIQSIDVGFGEIDWYDDMTDIYEVPSFKIGTGLRKAKVYHEEHGSIPKGWSLDVTFKIKNTKTIGPLMECIKSCIILTTAEEKELTKKIRKVLKGEVGGIYEHFDMYD